MKKTIRLVTTFFILVLALGTGLAQDKGSIRGKVVDEKTGELLMFANVVIKNSNPPLGGNTDIDGNFEVELDPGIYSLEVSYVGYDTKVIEAIEVKSREKTIVDVTLTVPGVELETIVIKGEKMERTENALLAIQRKAITIQDGISSQEMSRYGSGNAAESMKRVTGASVVGGKYIYVRGLGDRYSSSQLNGQQMPSTDPYRNSTQLDLIPSNLLDNIIASKTFTPDQPGNFTGGNVNLKTKSFPERFTLSASISSSFNTVTSLQDNFLTYQGGSNDFWGYDDGSRALPEILKQENVTSILAPSLYVRARRDNDLAALADQAANSLNKQKSPETKRSGLNNGVNFSIGNEFKIGNNPLGVLFGANFKRSFSYYDNATLAYFEPKSDSENSDLNFDRNLVDTKSTESPQIGGLFNLAYKFGGSSKINFNALYNHDSEKTARFIEGSFSSLFDGTFQSRALQFTEREMMSLQLNGEHVLTKGGVKFEWSANKINMMQEEPDFIQFANNYIISNNVDTSFFIPVSELAPPSHFFRLLEDEQYSAKFDLTVPFLQSESKANRIKLGFNTYEKTRSFSDDIFQIYKDSPYASPYLGDPEAYFGDSNTGLISQEGVNQIGLFPIPAPTIARQNSYDGTEEVTAAYGMFVYDFNKFRIIGGARWEHTDIQVASRDTSYNKGSINTNDILPSVNLVYRIQEDMNIRASYNQTLARPNMRELAPFTSFDFSGDFRLTGNPELERTRIKNYDVRWELFPKPGELFAVSGYYKQFENPIVRAFRIEANNEIQFQNVAEANVYGLEFEFRKNLDFISPRLSNFKFSANASLIKSVVDISEDEQDLINRFNPGKGTTRQFQGQSPFLLNTALNYRNDTLGIDAILSFNVFGRRMSEINSSANPDIFEDAVPLLDFSIAKSIGENLSLKLAVRNILGSYFQKSMIFQDEKYIIQRYDLGQTFTVGLSYNIRK